MAEPPPDWRPHLGRKVSLRYRIAGDPEHPFSEMVGVVQSVGWAEGHEVLTLVGRRGRVETIPVRDVLAARLL